MLRNRRDTSEPLVEFKGQSHLFGFRSFQPKNNFWGFEKRTNTCNTFKNRGDKTHRRQHSLKTKYNLSNIV